MHTYYYHYYREHGEGETTPQALDIPMRKEIPLHEDDPLQKFSIHVTVTQD